jgi:hypothetical protein
MHSIHTYTRTCMQNSGIYFYQDLPLYVMRALEMHRKLAIERKKRGTDDDDDDLREIDEISLRRKQVCTIFYVYVCVYAYVYVCVYAYVYG